MGYLESNIAIVLSSDALKITEESLGLHFTLLTLAEWWEQVCIFLPELKSQILTVVSAEPDANIFRWELFNDNDRTESVWLPYFHFLVLLVNFFGFFLLEAN